MAAKKAILNLASKAPDILVDDELGSSSSGEEEVPEQRGSHGSRRSDEGGRGRRKGPRRGKSPTRKKEARSLSPRRQASGGSAAANKRAEVSALSRSNTTSPAPQAPLRRNRTEVPNAEKREGPSLNRSRTTTNTGTKKTRDRSKSPRRVNSKDMDRSRGNNNQRTRRSPARRGEGRSRSPVRRNVSGDKSPTRQPRGPCSKARSPRQVHAAQANQLLAALPEPVRDPFLDEPEEKEEPQQPSEEEEESESEQEPEKEQQEEPEEAKARKMALERSEGGKLTNSSSNGVGRAERGMGISRAKAKREVRQTTGESKHTSSAVQPGMYRNMIQSSSP